MPADRSQLPPLPGKPDWYVENAPRAVESLMQQPRAATGLPAYAEARVPPQSDPTLVPSASPLAAPAFPTVETQPGQGKGLNRVRALAGRLRH